MLRVVRVAVTILLIAVVTRLRAQSADQKPVAFEVASVKLHTTSGINERSGIEENASAIRVENLPLKNLIEAAYGVRDYQFSGPGWLNERYDIVAKPPPGFTHAQFQPLLQTLLADRFKLSAHRETKEMSVYELVAVKSGATLRESTGPRTFFTSRPSLISGTRVSMREFTAALSGLLDRTVIEHTGLTGLYDVKVQWTPDSAAGDLGVSLFTAIQEQLGLKLESSRGPVEMLVIDHVEKPTAD
jgi:uncharacterized protein (TIGR03435 family)